MPSRTLATLSIIAAGVLAPAAIADAAGKKASGYPTVKKIAPMSVSIGETMTISGSGYVKGKGKNTVVFRRPGQRAIFVKADGLSTSRLSVVVPEKLRSSLGKTNGAASPTKFQIRVLAKRFGKTYTPLKSSPTVLPAAAAPLVDPKAAPLPAAAPAAAAPPAAATSADPPVPKPNCDGDALLDEVDPDDDNDLLPDATETSIGTTVCGRDTDEDGMEDGWEYQSAIDRNQGSCPKPPASTDNAYDYPRPCKAATPFPTKKSYTNPRVKDADTDYDGDWLDAGLEFAAWYAKGQQDKSYRALIGPKGMWYSDGKQASVDTAPDSPVDNDCVGMRLPSELPFGGNYRRAEFNSGTAQAPVYPQLDVAGVVKPQYEIYLPSRGDGNECLDDSERDEDGDFLSNREELNTMMSGAGWWSVHWTEPIFRITYDGTDWLLKDSDGDGIMDSLDDEDGDDFLNIEELYRGPTAWDLDDNKKTVMTGDLSGLWVDPYNPCLPNFKSKLCPTGVPLGNPGAWRPFAADPKKPQVPRWPLYKQTLYSNIEYKDPTWVDDGNPATLPNEAPTLTGYPSERWVAPGVTQSAPPPHPLPRP